MMRFTYESERLLLMVLHERAVYLVQDFLSRNRTLFNSFEAEKTAEFYSESFISNMLSQEYNRMIKGEHIRYYIFKKEDLSRIIGTVSFAGFRNTPYHSCHIGYKFDPEFHHQGYAYEAVAELLKCVVPEYKFHRVEAHIQLDNQPSIRLVEKLGFEYEGIAKHYAKIKGEWQDHMQYALICDT